MSTWFHPGMDGNERIPAGLRMPRFGRTFRTGRGAPLRSGAATAAAIAAFGILAVGLFAAGCSKGKGAPAGPPPASVTSGTSKQADVPIEIQAIGTVQPKITVAVRALVGGQLMRVPFTEGQDVAAGDVLFVIDPRPYQAALDQARAALARDTAQEESADATARRYADLVKSDFVTKEQAEDALATAQASRATMRADSASIETARLNLTYCTIRSPISGRTGSVLVQLGNLVKANDTQPLVVINQIIPALVDFSVPQKDLAQIRSYAASGALPVDVTMPPDSTHAIRGTLTFVDNTVDLTSGTVMMKATFPNSDQVLWPGQFVNVILHLSVRKGAVVVPSSAVQPGQNGEIVWMIKADRTVEMRPVSTGGQWQGQTIIDQGIQPGEEVVTDGQVALYSGARVVIRTESGTPAAPPAGQQPAGAKSDRAAGAGAGDKLASGQREGR